MVNGGDLDGFVHLQPCASYSGQFWKLTKYGDWYRLTTQFKGDAMCLDIINGGPHDGMAHLAQCEDVSGQHWQLN